MAGSDAPLIAMPASFFRKGEHLVWLAGAAIAFFLALILLMLGLILVKGGATFWPRDLVSVSLKGGETVVGTVVGSGEAEGGKSVQFRVANRDLYGMDFRWIAEPDITELAEAGDYWSVERVEYGDLIGLLTGVHPPPASGAGIREAFLSQLRASSDTRERIDVIQDEMSELNNRVRENELLQRARQMKDGADPAPGDLEAEAASLTRDFEALHVQLQQIEAERDSNYAVFTAADGQSKNVPFLDIVRAVQPGQMGLAAKLGYYMQRIAELLADEPRESNTEGGLFPAIFGTVMLIFLMAIISFPFGVVAGIYLREYARDGFLVRVVRIGVNNLSGIPSIVYGIFGLGFFVYTLGSSLDAFFFAEKLPEPTFGTGGILWASLTLGILTIPVVIVATEEALGSVPSAVRDNSIALGATKFQTLTRVVLPMASPGILTGFILAMARAAGEVAPLMITGVVKLAPDLPLDGQFPFAHLDRKFMHLGFHIYDISMQSPNVEAAKPMVYVTTFLLIIIVLSLTSTAIYLRNRMHKRYSMGSM